MRYLYVCLLVALCLPGQSRGQERLPALIDPLVASRSLELARIALPHQSLKENGPFSSSLYDMLFDLRFNLVFGSGFLGYVAGGCGSGLAVHHLAPHSSSEAITPEEIAAFIIGGSLSSALIVHLVEGREGNFAYTAGGALLSQVAAAGVAGGLFLLGRLTKAEGFGWLGLGVSLSMPFMASFAAYYIDRLTTPE